MSTHSLNGRTALVTGGGAGIGKACVEALTAAGAAVLITDVDAAAAAAVARDLSGRGRKVAALMQDVTNEKRWPDVIAECERLFGGLDIVVANAGIAIAGPLVEMSLEDWRRQQAVNLDGVFLSLKYGIPALRKVGGGSIIIMSSIAGMRGSANLAGYGATKAAVRYLAKSAALECAAAGDRIRVNSVHPGIIDTAIWTKMPAGARRLNAPPDPHQLAKDMTPMGTAGVPADIADAVVFLASDASRYMTGAELVVDGGVTAGSIRRL
jgi:NAD(P)-dependent dehydrogenase (short-subunit alcohol dehydrogenase family)